MSQRAMNDQSATKSGYAEVNGLRMYYEVHGAGEPLLLLHGAFMTIDTSWSELSGPLAAQRQVIAVELQGHGRTADIARPLSYEALADDVAALMRAALGWTAVETAAAVSAYRDGIERERARRLGRGEEPDVARRLRA